jgi:Mn2+/Fe2+ NRAMP family transporter
MQFYQQASVVEKEIKIEHYRYSALDTVLGGVVVTVVCFFIVLTCGSTLHKAGIEIKDAADAAQALKPLAGRYCADLFAVGLMAAAHFAGAILPISTAFAVCEGFGWERGVNKNFAQAPQFYVVVSLMMFGGAAVVLIPNIPLIPVMIISQVLNGILLPFVLVFILLLINNRKIMRDWKNGPVLNAIAIMATVVVSTLTLVFTTLTVWELLS